MDYDGLDGLLNTANGMDCLRNNTGLNSGADKINGPDWFKFNGIIVDKLYVSGDHTIGFGVNSAQLKVCNRDGKMWYLYRQEGTVYGYYRFLKIRWEGSTYYGSVDISYALKFELILFDTGDMLLNVLQVPTNGSYMGASALICNGQTTPLTIPINTPTMVSFYHLDETGMTWDIKYEQINIKPPYITRYLLQDGAGVMYTVREGVLTALEAVEAVTGQYILNSGFGDKPTWSHLQGLTNPTVLCWHDNMIAPVLTAEVTAIPPDQVVTSELYNMSHPTIAGIESVTVDADEMTQFSVSFDGGVTWRAWDGTEWVIVDAGGGMTADVLEAVTMEQWALVQTSLQYKIRAALTEGSAVRSIVINYANREAINV